MACRSILVFAPRKNEALGKNGFVSPKASVTVEWRTWVIKSTSTFFLGGNSKTDFLKQSEFILEGNMSHPVVSAV